MKDIPLKCDQWASMLRNSHNVPDDTAVGLTDKEASELSTLLTAAANEICRRARVPGDMRRWLEAQIEENKTEPTLVPGPAIPVGAYREGKDKAWRDALAALNELAPRPS